MIPITQQALSSSCCIHQFHGHTIMLCYAVLKLCIFEPSMLMTSRACCNYKHANIATTETHTSTTMCMHVYTLPCRCYCSCTAIYTLPCIRCHVYVTMYMLPCICRCAKLLPQAGFVCLQWSGGEGAGPLGSRRLQAASLSWLQQTKRQASLCCLRNGGMLRI